MLKNLITFDHGTCGCKKSKQKDVLDPKPRPKNVTTKSATTKTSRQEDNDDDDRTTSTTTTTTTAGAATTLSFRSTKTRNCSEITHHNIPITTAATKMVYTYPKLGDSLAVVEDSDDPYGDFRQSMLQMILERNIYSRDDLQELLDCFLQLNSNDHHQIIVRAFMEIWNGVVNADAASKCTTTTYGGDGGG